MPSACGVLLNLSLVSKLVSAEGKILIPGVNDLIAPLTDDEVKKFNDIHFKIEDIHNAIGGDQTLSSDPVKTLMGRMRKLVYAGICKRKSIS